MMHDLISGIVSQAFQQTQENQTLKQPQTDPAGKRSFESYLQQDNKQVNGNQTAPETPKIENPATSGVQMQTKLNQMQDDLARRFNQTVPEKNKVNSILPDLLDNKTRLGMLKEAYSKIGDTSKATSDLSGRFTQVEGEYKQVEAIMTSDKNLSPGELLALQARLYQVSQHIEVMSKVVDQMAGGIKTVLNTNV